MGIKFKKGAVGTIAAPVCTMQDTALLFQGRNRARNSFILFLLAGRLLLLALFFVFRTLVTHRNLSSDVLLWLRDYLTTSLA